MRNLPMVFQSESSDCGLSCVNMIAGYWGLEVEYSLLKRHFKTDLEGHNIHTIMSTLETLNISSRMIAVEPEDLIHIEGPAILHWNLGHYVVLKKATRKGIEIHDPDIGPVFIDRSRIGKHLSGYAIECLPTENFQKGKFKQKRKVSDLWNKLSGANSSFGLAITLSLGLFVGVLASPFFMKYTIDNVLINNDFNLLFMVGGAFLLATIMSTIVRYIRDMVVMHIGNKISLQIGSNLLSHILKLPLTFFEKRKIGDLNAKFSAIERVREAMTDGLMVIVVDGFLASVALLVLVYFAPLLALISFIAVATYLAMRILSYNRIRQYHDESLIATGAEQSAFYETLSGMQAIKLFGRESERFSIWQNTYKESMDKRLKIGLFESFVRSFNDLIYHVETIAIVVFGVMLIINKEISVGMLFVAMSYKNIFSDRIRACMDHMTRYKLLTVFLENIGDIIDHETDTAHRDLPAPPQVEKGTLFEAKNIYFRYKKESKNILDNVSFGIKKGESVAFIGRSGEGKSTLIKMLLGLYYPDSGKLLYANKEINQINVRSLRERIGVVMQNDQLLSGSVMENITFFDTSPDEKWAYECAKSAMIFDDVANMSMGFDSLIGDMGSTLSGGQKQRLMIARALYRKPEILILDEGTANLDIETEARLLARLKEFNITIISVAHRPETVKFSERLFSLSEGTMKEVDISRLEQIRNEVFDSELLRSA